MKTDSPITVSALLLVSLQLPLGLKADETDDDAVPNTDFEPDTEYVEGAVKQEQYDKTTRWVFSAGSTTRSINAGFQLNGSQASFNWRNFLSQKPGRSNVGLYRGGNRPAFYDDGYVEPHNINPPSSGTAGGQVKETRSHGTKTKTATPPPSANNVGRTKAPLSKSEPTADSM
ncbi:MAG: hypothetical protein L3J39_12250 [Verrucomicrobiales bacterium]|nr:hypothetical protein [Verrucomicrobiales bacterium]